MGKIKDLTGWRVGALRVLSKVDMVKYGGRRQPLWLCECDCGNQIKLPSDKLPTTEKTRKTMMRSGRRLYDSCEKCRQKNCVICGEQFSFSHTSHVCPKPNCKEQLRLERDAFWHSVEKYRYKNDPEYRAKYRDRYNAWYHRNKSKIQNARRDWYQSMKADPDRYQDWLAWRRQQRRQQVTNQQLRSMLDDAQTLQSIFEKEQDNE